MSKLQIYVRFPCTSAYISYKQLPYWQNTSIFLTTHAAVDWLSLRGRSPTERQAWPLSPRVTSWWVIEPPRVTSWCIMEWPLSQHIKRTVPCTNPCNVAIKLVITISVLKVHTWSVVLDKCVNSSLYWLSMWVTNKQVFILYKNKNSCFTRVNMRTTRLFRPFWSLNN